MHELEEHTRRRHVGMLRVQCHTRLVRLLLAIFNHPFRGHQSRRRGPRSPSRAGRRPPESWAVGPRYGDRRTRSSECTAKRARRGKRVGEPGKRLGETVITEAESVGKALGQQWNVSRKFGVLIA